MGRSVCLETMIQRQTARQKSLDDLFRLMESRFGLTRKGYALEDLQRAASEVAATDLAEFFSPYVASPEALPVRDVYRMLDSKPQSLTPLIGQQGDKYKGFQAVSSPCDGQK